MQTFLVLIISVAPLLVLLATHAQKSRETYMARAVAFGVLAFFWLSLGITCFIVGTHIPMFRHVSNDVLAIGWTALFGLLLWATVWNVKKASRVLLEQIARIIQMPYQASPEEHVTPSQKEQPMQLDTKEAEEKLQSLMGK